MTKLKTEQLKKLLLQMREMGNDGTSFEDIMSEIESYLVRVVKE
ncbi:hypothetical protein [Aquibacillus salsiterrae]|nr:hypothetical protein [Aquibacillus salsiterrae]